MAPHNPSTDAVDDVTRHANRAAVLVFASGFAIIVALVIGSSVLRDASSGGGVAAFAAVALAVVVTAWAWRARAQLRAARVRAERSPTPADAGGAIADASRRGGGPRGRREPAPLTPR